MFNISIFQSSNTEVLFTKMHCKKKHPTINDKIIFLPQMRNSTNLTPQTINPQSIK